MSNLHNLNPTQQEAVLHSTGPALVVSGPGSGKTRVLTHRIIHLIQQRGVNPSSILGITFTNKAAREIKERVHQMLSESANPSSTWLGTFHSTCVRILRIDGSAINIPNNFVIYATGDSQSLIKKALKQLGIEGKSFHPRAVMSVISNNKNELVTPTEFSSKAYGYFQQEVAKVYPLYQKMLKQANALDFNDLLSEVVRLFEQAPQVREKYQNKFQHILVDEYQDTNHTQYKLVKTLSAKHQNIFCVGDASQSIYSWRGADFRNILRFEKDYPQATIYRLGQNYRSTPQIVSASQALIQNNKTHIPIQLWTQNPEGAPISLYKADSELYESAYIIKTIQRSGRSLNNFAVLYRTNAQSRILEDQLIKSGIPYRLVGGVRFYERKEVADVLAFLKIFFNPADTVNWERVLALPLAGRRLTRDKKATFLETLFTKLHNQKITLPLDVLDEVLTETKYLNWLRGKGKEEEYRVENVKELRSVATGFETVGQFLENVALVQDGYMPEGTHTQSTGAVTLMTLHSAKGLEFPEVFMVGMEEGLFPHANSMMDRQELEEERRLCYVGITRAIKKLHLTYAKQRFYFGNYQNNSPSRFLDEIPEELIEEISY